MVTSQKHKERSWRKSCEKGALKLLQVKRHKKYWQKQKKISFDVNEELGGPDVGNLMMTGTMKKQKVEEEDEEGDTGSTVPEILVTGDIEEEGGGEEEGEVEAWMTMMMTT